MDRDRDRGMDMNMDIDKAMDMDIGLPMSGPTTRNSDSGGRRCRPDTGITLRLPRDPDRQPGWRTSQETQVQHCVVEVTGSICFLFLTY